MSLKGTVDWDDIIDSGRFFSIAADGQAAERLDGSVVEGPGRGELSRPRLVGLSSVRGPEPVDRCEDEADLTELSRDNEDSGIDSDCDNSWSTIAEAEAVRPGVYTMPATASEYNGFGDRARFPCEDDLCSSTDSGSSPAAASRLARAWSSEI